jgi:hypothetical protein
MIFDQTRIQELVSRRAESLNVEVKRWLISDGLNGIAKIVRAAFTLQHGKSTGAALEICLLHSDCDFFVAQSGALAFHVEGEGK